jgi:hypothetical protein
MILNLGMGTDFSKPILIVILFTPAPAQTGLVLRHRRQAASDAAVAFPHWLAQPWHLPSLQAAATTVQLAGPVPRRTRHTERHPRYEEST